MAGPKFESELHLLCEEAKWNEVKSILLQTLASPTMLDQIDDDPSVTGENHKWPVGELADALIEREGHHQWTPLMISCVRAPLEVIALLCHAGPEACLIPDRSGSLPLHFVACWRRGLPEETTDILKIMVECSPSSIGVQNTWGQTPLHSLLDSKTLPSVASVRTLLGQGDSNETKSNQGGGILMHRVNKPQFGEQIEEDAELIDEGEIDKAKEPFVMSALATPDLQNRLPLHIAAAKGAPEEVLKLLVNAFPDATFVANGKGDLPAHLLHFSVDQPQSTGSSGDDGTVSTSTSSTPTPTKQQGISVGSMEALLTPLAVGKNPAKRFQKDEQFYPRPTSWPQLYSLVKQLEKERTEGGKASSPQFWEAETSKPPTTPSQVACRCGGSTGDLLPIHLGADHGVDMEVLRGICRQYPEGVRKLAIMPELNGKGVSIEDEAEEKGDYDEEKDENDTPEGISSKPMCPLEIFEKGRAGREAAAAAQMQRNLAAHEGAPSMHLEKVTNVLSSFVERSDLLFSYHLNATSSSEVRYRDNPGRMKRIEQLIRYEARIPSGKLSDTAAILWTYFCQYHNANDRRDNFVKNVGRILTGLNPPALWKLTLVPAPFSSTEEDRYLKVACTGRTIAREAEFRAPSITMEHALKYYWLQWLVATYLDPMDALNYSAVCRRTRACGCRLLPQVPLRVTEGHWEKPNNPDSTDLSPPKPWQRLDVLVVPDCTHTVFVSYYVECRRTQELSDNSDHRAFGGMLVVRDDIRKLRPNVKEPWGDAVVAYSEIPPVSGALVRLSFQHVPGRSYGLWHYNHGGPGSSLSVSDVRVRQLLHSCDARGRSPLHLLLSSVADSSSVNPRLNLHVSMLLAAKFGTGDAVGDVPLHYALKCGVNEDVLQAIISASPEALVETDKEGRTPMHAAFLLSKDEPPALGVIRALLTTPGENAIKLKDSSGRLPLHIATERGAGEAILRLLVDAYQDGCYRTNRDGDLPIHLLLKSGAATTTSVELLIRPIMQNESICRIGGSRGVNLPLHIAAEYQCNFRIFEKLLQTYGEAAIRPRTRPSKHKSDQQVTSEDSFYYPLDIFEESWIARSSNGGKRSSLGTSDAPDSTTKAKEAAEEEVNQADFKLRADLIFAYHPLLKSRTTGKYYRNDRSRIKRLSHMIRREAIQCGEDRKINRRANLTDMAKQSWIFLCTYSNPDDSTDNYVGTVRKILRGLTASAVDVLAHVENPRSLPISGIALKDCATPLCQVLILSRMRFVGRYVLYDELHPVHKSESCLVMRANDHGLADEYQRILSIYRAQEQDVEEDISDAGSMDEAKIAEALTRPNAVTMEMFLIFADRLGVEVPAAKSEIHQLNKQYADEPNPGATVPRRGSFDSDDEGSKTKVEAEDEAREEIGKEAFATFCRGHRLNDKGVRTVVIKFMKSLRQFEREKEVRSMLDLSGASWPVVPILDDYNVDRIEKSRKRDIDIFSLRDDTDGTTMAPENGDELYALDIQEKNASVHNFALYKYAVVMPAGDRDFAEICQHEELGILQIRDYMLQLGTALKCLHDQSMIHGDLKMANVVRFGKTLALIDFDSTCRFEKKPPNSTDKMGGGSSKFCTGVLPPEMLERIDLVADYNKLTQYENYWSHISEDAKDLNLLTPDDIQTITSVVKALLSKVDVAKNLGTVNPIATLRDKMNEVYSTLENRDDWKDILSISLITISFEDLPYSLNCCDGVEEFAEVWNRLLFHSKMWEKVRPRISQDDRYAYVIKTHNDIPNDRGIIERHDRSKVPYELVSPSQKIDVWAFGVLLFALCGGGSLFPLGFEDDLNDTEAFEQLYGWDRLRADKKVRAKVDDPLAQDLLLQVLVPESERLPNMEVVLEHPFFGPSSSDEAQRILEKHEEEQLILEETVLVKRMTTDTRRVVDNAMEKQCKIIFNEKKIVVPTCLIVLPYELERGDGENLTIGTETDLGLAVRTGQYLLNINKATARLSFWLMMKRSFGSDKNHASQFKTKMKGWLKRIRTEKSDVVAKDIVTSIGCGSEYTKLCVELLEHGDSISHAKAYLKDPMAAARQDIFESIDALVKCYSSQYFYLVDEFYGVPVRSEESIDFGEGEAKVYPIRVDPNSGLFQNLFLTFMNLAVMKLTAGVGLPALARLLGLPRPYGVPASWKESVPGLVHSRNKPSSIAEFAVLHEVIRRQSQQGGNSNGDEMRQLEDFLRDKDPMRTFADLRRVSDGKENSTAMWTTEAEVRRIQSQLEVASLEYKLRELKKEWVQKQKIQSQITTLTKQVHALKSGGVVNGNGNGVEHARQSRNKGRNGSEKTKSFEDTPVNGNGQKSTLKNGIDETEQSASNQKRKKMRKRQKPKFRPYFGVC